MASSEIQFANEILKRLPVFSGYFAGIFWLLLVFAGYCWYFLDIDCLFRIFHYFQDIPGRSKSELLVFQEDSGVFWGLPALDLAIQC